MYFTIQRRNQFHVIFSLVVQFKINIYNIHGIFIVNFLLLNTMCENVQGAVKERLKEKCIAIKTNIRKD